MSAVHAAAADWRTEWFEIEDATYLDTATQGAMPRIALDAVQQSFEAKRFPHRMDDSRWFEVPNRLRSSLSRLIGARPEEIALATGSSTGLAIVAHGLAWRAGDEVITATGEFPMQYATWKPMEEREGIMLRVVSPRGAFLSADDLIAALTPRTRVISVSHVRFDDGSLLDVPRVAAACHAQGALLVLDVTQSCGALPIDVGTLGADFVVCAGYKWLLSPYGTGFLWVKRERMDTLRPGPFYWTGQLADSFADFNFADPRPSHSARRFDSAEAATYYNFNLTAMASSVEFVSRIGADTVLAHNRRLIAHLFERLPRACVPASPLDATQRGAYGCFTARSPERTTALYQRLREANVVVAMREGRIRVSPHLFNSVRDIDRLLDVIAT